MNAILRREFDSLCVTWGQTESLTLHNGHFDKLQTDFNYISIRSLKNDAYCQAQARFSGTVIKMITCRQSVKGVLSLSSGGGLGQ